jgi:hypothetical protein
MITDINIAAIAKHVDERGNISPAAAPVIEQTINRWLQAPDPLFCHPEDRKIAGALQHFTLHGDFPADVRDLIGKFVAVTDLDIGWRSLYRVASQPEGDGFDIVALDGDGGFAFTEHIPGQRTEIRRMAGQRIRVPMVVYTDAFGWDPMVWKWRRYVEVADGLNLLRADGYNRMASLAYSLLDTTATAHPAGVIAYGGVGGEADVHRLAQTANDAATAIILGLQNMGINLNNPQFKIVVPIAMRARFHAITAFLTQAFAGSPTVAAYNFEVIYSNNLQTAAGVPVVNQFYVVLPERTWDARIQVPLTLEYDGDILQRLEYCAAHFVMGIGASAAQACVCATA